ncbi:multidrug effflux MFS transporter [Methanosarcina barkeri]|uniref:multidrug effflux MFS transporter n=1 Tax=Methanosarcina barkeri TaxID=2208 RepID=UPI001E610CD9|nr:multidrug effflux MFS transporter [Methanosarcina barkeri]
MKVTVPLLALLSAFPPLTTDMILPALPDLAKSWNVSLSLINLNLVFFFVTYGLFLLFYGPISDRYGRRRPLLVGLAVYIVTSLLGAFVSGAPMLIGTRILQAAGAAAGSSISMAMTKDIFVGSERERILAYIAVIMGLAPMLAPIIGGWILLYMSWHWIFLMEAFMGIIAMFGVLHFPETLPEVSETPLSQVINTYGRLLLNPPYMIMVLVMSVSFFPLFSFIAGSSAIYINEFGLSEQKYSYFFALNALAIMTGAFSCLRLTRRVNSKHLMTIAFAGVFLGGIFLLFMGQHGPWSFALSMFMVSFSLGLSRPPSNNLALEQVDQDIGSASSLLIFTYFIFGAVSMWFISLEWADKIPVLGTTVIVCGALVFTAWFVIQKRGVKGIA